MGFEDSKHPDYVCKLQRSPYGLEQAPKGLVSTPVLVLAALGIFWVSNGQIIIYFQVFNGVNFYSHIC